MVYGLLVGNYVPVVAVDSCGTALSVVFMAIYYKYAPDLAYIHKLWLGLGLVEVVIVAYVTIGAAGLTNQSRHQVRMILGFITAGTDVVMYSSPLATLRHVLKIKDASSMPLTMSIVALINTVLWVIVSTDDLFLAIPNGLGCVFSIIGIIIYFIYRPGKFQPPSEEHRPESEVNLQEIRVEASQKTAYGELQSPVESNPKQ
jgi:solute carrier family 50 protein (sugar transporter)